MRADQIVTIATGSHPARIVNVQNTQSRKSTTYRDLVDSWDRAGEGEVRSRQEPSLLASVEPLQRINDKFGNKDVQPTLAVKKDGGYVTPDREHQRHRDSRTLHYRQDKLSGVALPDKVTP